jgi:beta-glucanase (GH16 family)
VTWQPRLPGSRRLAGSAGPVVGALLAALALLQTAVARGQDWGRAVWSDEFDGAAGSPPDPARWTYDVGDLGVNNEIETYCSPAFTTPPCDASDPNAYRDGRGHLVIRAVRRAGGAWTSARLKTQGLEEFQYGRIEASMRLPVGPGLWPAFWMLGGNIASVGWPACGEIDLMENVPVSAGLGPTTVRSTLHGPGYSGSAGLGRDYSFTRGGRVDTSFHTYGALWSPRMIQFYVDEPRNVFFVRTERDVPAGQPWVYDHPFFAILNLAVGGDWPGPPDASTPTPTEVLVDHVRVYHASAIAGPSLRASPIALKAGATATGALELAAAPGSGRVYVDCAGAPAQATCLVNPYVVDFSEAPEATATLVVATRAPTGVAGVAVGFRTPLAASLGVALLAAYVLRGRGRATGLLVAFALLAVLAPACGGAGGAGASTGTGTPPGSYTLTVTAYTLSGDSSAVAVPLTVSR